MKQIDIPNASHDPEYGVDSRYESKDAQREDGLRLLEQRKKDIAKMDPSILAKARLTQLKIAMEKFIQRPVYKVDGCFTEFLSSYIDTIYFTQKSFAKSIDINPIQLSQIINNHKKPHKTFLMRLMAHSEMIYENVCEFDKLYWYEVLLKERMAEMKQRHDDSIEETNKHIIIDLGKLTMEKG